MTATRGRSDLHWSGLTAVIRGHRMVLALLAGALMVLASGLVALHVRTAPAQVSVSVHRLPLGSVSSVAGDCPYLSDCEEFDADSQALRALTAALPSADVAGSYALGIGPLRSFQYVAAATPDGVQVIVQARCDGRSDTTGPSSSAAAAGRAVSRPLAPMTGRGPVLVSGLRVTASGCTVGLVAQVPPGVAVPHRALAALLADRRVTLDG
ncbi:MAG: hypothetical protein ABJA87_11285 [bacterium]